MSHHRGLLFTDKSRAHHARHVRVTPQLGIKPGMRDDDGPRRHFERRFCGLHIGVRKIDKDTQPVTFLDNGRSKSRQSPIARRVGVNVAQRHRGITIVK